MIDSKTGQKILVKIHNEYGPYIQVTNYDDSGALEDLFDDEFYVLYWTKTFEDLADYGGKEYYFGNAADPERLQSILDEIEF